MILGYPRKCWLSEEVLAMRCSCWLLRVAWALAMREEVLAMWRGGVGYHAARRCWLSDGRRWCILLRMIVGYDGELVGYMQILG